MSRHRIAALAGVLLVSCVSTAVSGASPTPIVRDQHWPSNSGGVYNSGFTFPEGVVSDVTVDGVLDHIDIPISLRFEANGGVLNWFIFDAKNNEPFGSQPRASGIIPNFEVDGSVTVALSTYGLIYHPGDQFTFAIQGSGEGNYLWYSYRGFDAKLHREFRLFGSTWTLDDPPLNPPPSYAPGYSTYFAIPEPSAILLVEFGVPLVFSRRRYRACSRRPLVRHRRHRQGRRCGPNTARGGR